ncbi:hypothetical protein DBR32_14785 [Taibaiella sp. KBW10]|uniref:T9SS type A sorting domain-containing protein n=1 Tax=Taibaiella sp. KBW10 TaxID=2153357 RepID=UPI000F59A455|nr:T9SS type A sorting domain-containing protein [Taibaiella sp. KBW10]RQO29845.1 hypothetical protein DBR32_14785 [Taibaiella sp. KBW10]
MAKQVKLLLIMLFLTAAEHSRAQTIDSFHVNRSVNPHELFVRFHFPDSSYSIVHTFDRVALIYPPVNVITFFYRSCDFIKTNPVMDTIIRIYTPEPYRIHIWLVNDTNTVIQGCTFIGRTQNPDSASYDSRHTTGMVNPGTGSKALHIYPNPATNILHVVGASGCTLLVSDALGRMQLRQQLKNEQETLNIGSLTPGVYYIHCYQDGLLLHSRCFSKLP